MATNPPGSSMSFFDSILKTIGISQSHKTYPILDTMTLREKDFYSAANRYFDLQKHIDPKLRIHLISLFKQATIGDCSMVQPPKFAKQKQLHYTGWDVLRGVSKTEAASFYVDNIVEIDKKLQSEGKVQPPGEPSTSPSKGWFGKKRKKKDEETLEAKLDRVLSVQDPSQYTHEVEQYMQSNRSLADNLVNPRANSKLQRSNTQSNPPQQGGFQEVTQSQSFANVKPNAMGPPNSMNTRPQQNLVNPPPRGPSMELKSKYKAGGSEYKRFTMMKINSMKQNKAFTSNNLNFDVVDAVQEELDIGMNTSSLGQRQHVPSMLSMGGYSIGADSFMSFSRNTYAYNGQSLRDLINDTKVKSNLNKKSLINGAYGEVLPVIYLLSVEFNSTLDKSVRQKQALKGNFSGINVPKLNLDLFILRLVRYLDKWFRDIPSINSVGCRSILITSVYLRRIEEYIEGFKFTKYNIHKLLAVCMLLAAKFCEDCIIANSYWAQVAGFSIEEINQAEEIFCTKTNFDLYVDQKELDAVFDKYYLTKV